MTTVNQQPTIVPANAAHPETVQDADFLEAPGAVLQRLVPMSAGRATVPAFTTGAPRQSIPVYFIREGTTDRAKRAIMASLTLCGRCNETRPAAWQSLVLTWTVVCFPELVRAFRDDNTAVDYVYEPFPEDFANSCVEAVMAQGSEDTAGDLFILFPPGLPNAAVVPMNGEIVQASSIEALYGYYAMMVFIMGKSLSPQNIAAISTKRPDAIIRKRQLSASAYILTGSGQIHPDNYRHIQSGWIRSTRHRMTVVRHLARMAASPNKSEILDSVSVNMEMLRNSGQSYIFYIHELIVACPWVTLIPSLRSSYYHYIKMVNILAEQEDYIRPYYKLMMQDAAKDVRRRDIEPLIAVATFFAAQTRRTMNQYRISEGMSMVLLAFRVMAESKGMVFADIPDQLTTEVTAV